MEQNRRRLDERVIIPCLRRQYGLRNSVISVSTMTPIRTVDTVQPLTIHLPLLLLPSLDILPLSRRSATILLTFERDKPVDSTMSV